VTTPDTPDLFAPIEPAAPAAGMVDAASDGAEDSASELVDVVEPAAAPDVEEYETPPSMTDASAVASVRSSLVVLGHVNFDGGGGDNTSTTVMVPPDNRRAFRRETYVGISDEEQGLEFLGRVVEGPFYAPHEVGAESTIGRTTVLFPERTRFRPTYYVAGTIEVIGEITEGSERVTPTATRPRPYSKTYVFPSDRLERMLGLSGNFVLGKLQGYEDVTVHADGDNKNFLPRNVGVFGTVGSGKSNTTQVLIEEATAAGWAVVVVDVEGEYVRMNEPTDDDDLAHILRDRYGHEPQGVTDVVVYVPSSGSSDALKPVPFKAPISKVEAHVMGDLLELTEAQMRMLLQLTEQLHQFPPSKARPAPTARMGVLAGAVAGATPPPAYDFALQDMIDHLKEDNRFVSSRPQIEKATAHTLCSKLITLGMSHVLDWNKTKGVNYLPVRDLLTPGRLSVLDVSETDDRSRNICISYLLQALFDEVVRTEIGKTVEGTSLSRPPLLVVLEEVHTFVSKASAHRMRTVLDQLQVVSRRGRKRWMGLVLVSQQPGHVPDELFELANTRFIHQLKSASNLAPVRATTGGVHDALWGTVPSLAPGGCLLTGATFRNPVFVQMRPAASRRMHIS
jgi:DNA helicase HerA-like ATPase